MAFPTGNEREMDRTLDQIQHLTSETCSADEKCAVYAKLLQMLGNGSLSLQRMRIGQKRQLLDALKDDIMSGMSSLAFRALRLLALSVAEERFCLSLSASESKSVLWNLCTSIKFATDRNVCKMGLHCLGQQQFPAAVIIAVLPALMDTLEEIFADKKSGGTDRVEMELAVFIQRLLKLIPAKMMAPCDKWGKVIIRLLLCQDVTARNMAFSILRQHIDVLSSCLSLRKFMAADFRSKERMVSQLKELFRIDQQRALQTTELLIEFFNVELHHGLLITCLLPVCELGFKSKTSESTKILAFRVWKKLISIYALDLGILTEPRRLALMMLVFRSNSNAKTERVALEKFSSWWSLVEQLDARIGNHFEQIVVPLLQFIVHGCVAADTSRKGVASPGLSLQQTSTVSHVSSSLKLGPTEKSAPFRSVLTIGPHVLARLLGPPPNYSQLPQCIFTLPSLRHEVFMTPLVFTKYASLLADALRELVCQLQGSFPESVLLYVWNSFLGHLNTAIASTNRPDHVEAVAAILNLLKALTLSRNVPPKTVLTLLSALMGMSHRVLSCTGYGNVTNNLLKGTPSLSLLEILLSPGLISVAPRSESFARVFTHLLGCGPKTEAALLLFWQSAVRLVKENVKLEEDPSLPVRLWEEIASTVFNHITKSNEVNQGDVLEYNFDCLYTILSFPVSRPVMATLDMPSRTNLMKLWTNLYRHFSRLSEMVVNADSNTCCEELSQKFLQAAPDEMSPEEVFILVSMCYVMVDCFVFSTLGADQDSFHQSSRMSPHNFMRRRGKPMLKLQSFVMLIRRLLSEANTCVLRQESNRRKQSQEKADVCLGINSLVDILQKLFTQVSFSSVIPAMVEELSPPMGDMYKAAGRRTLAALHNIPFMQKLEKLWLQVSTCLQSRYNGPYDSEFLLKLAPLLAVTFVHPRRVLQTQSLVFWSATFSRSAPLTYPDVLRPVLARVKEQMPVVLPGWISMDVPTVVVEESPLSQLSQCGDSIGLEPCLPGLPSLHRMRGSLLRRTESPAAKRQEKASPRTKATKRPISLEEMPAEDFVVIRSTPKRPKHLTEHQREVLQEQKFIPAMYSYFDAGSQDRSILDHFESQDSLDVLGAPTQARGGRIQMSAGAVPGEDRGRRSRESSTSTSSSPSQNTREQAVLRRPEGDSQNREPTVVEETQDSVAEPPMPDRRRSRRLVPTPLGDAVGESSSPEFGAPRRGRSQSSSQDSSPRERKPAVRERQSRRRLSQESSLDSSKDASKTSSSSVRSSPSLKQNVLGAVGGMSCSLSSKDTTPGEESLTADPATTDGTKSPTPMETSPSSPPRPKPGSQEPDHPSSLPGEECLPDEQVTAGKSKSRVPMETSPTLSPRSEQMSSHPVEECALSEQVPADEPESQLPMETSPSLLSPRSGKASQKPDQPSPQSEECKSPLPSPDRKGGRGRAVTKPSYSLDGWVIRSPLRSRPDSSRARGKETNSATDAPETGSKRTPQKTRQSEDDGAVCDLDEKKRSGGVKEGDLVSVEREGKKNGVTGATESVAKDGGETMPSPGLVPPQKRVRSKSVAAADRREVECQTEMSFSQTYDGISIVTYMPDCQQSNSGTGSQADSVNSDWSSSKFEEIWSNLPNMVSGDETTDPPQRSHWHDASSSQGFETMPRASRRQYGRSKTSGETAKPSHHSRGSADISARFEGTSDDSASSSQKSAAACVESDSAGSSCMPSGNQEGDTQKHSPVPMAYNPLSEQTLWDSGSTPQPRASPDSWPKSQDSERSLTDSSKTDSSPTQSPALYDPSEVSTLTMEDTSSSLNKRKRGRPRKYLPALPKKSSRMSEKQAKSSAKMAKKGGSPKQGKDDSGETPVKKRKLQSASDSQTAKGTKKPGPKKDGTVRKTQEQASLSQVGAGQELEASRPSRRLPAKEGHSGIHLQEHQMKKLTVAVQQLNSDCRVVLDVLPDQMLSQLPPSGRNSEGFMDAAEENATSTEARQKSSVPDSAESAPGDDASGGSRTDTASSPKEQQPVTKSGGTRRNSLRDSKQGVSTPASNSAGLHGVNGSPSLPMKNKPSKKPTGGAQECSLSTQDSQALAGETALKDSSFSSSEMECDEDVIPSSIDANETRKVEGERRVGATDDTAGAATAAATHEDMDTDEPDGCLRPSDVTMLARGKKTDTQKADMKLLPSDKDGSVDENKAREGPNCNEESHDISVPSNSPPGSPMEKAGSVDALGQDTAAVWNSEPMFNSEQEASTPGSAVTGEAGGEESGVLSPEEPKSLESTKGESVVLCPDSEVLQNGTGGAKENDNPPEVGSEPFEADSEAGTVDAVVCDGRTEVTEDLEEMSVPDACDEVFVVTSPEPVRKPASGLQEAIMMDSEVSSRGSEEPSQSRPLTVEEMDGDDEASCDISFFNTVSGGAERMDLVKSPCAGTTQKRVLLDDGSGADNSGNEEGKSSDLQSERQNSETSANNNQKTGGVEERTSPVDCDQEAFQMSMPDSPGKLTCAQLQGLRRLSKVSNRGVEMVRRSIIKQGGIAGLSSPSPAVVEKVSPSRFLEMIKECRISTPTPSPKSSPAESPLSGILKRGTSKESALTATPPKSRRVSFADPVVSGERPVYTTAAVREYRKRPLKNRGSPNRSSGLLASQSSYSSSPEMELSATLPIFPQLIGCRERIDRITPELTSTTMIRGLEQLLKSRKILTVGDLSAQTELQIFNLPLKSPKVESVRKTLRTFWRNLGGSACLSGTDPAFTRDKTGDASIVPEPSALSELDIHNFPKRRSKSDFTRKIQDVAELNQRMQAAGESMQLTTAAADVARNKGADRGDGATRLGDTSRYRAEDAEKENDDNLPLASMEEALEKIDSSGEMENEFDSDEGEQCGDLLLAEKSPTQSLAGSAQAKEEDDNASSTQVAQVTAHEVTEAGGGAVPEANPGPSTEPYDKSDDSISSLSVFGDSPPPLVSPGGTIVPENWNRPDKKGVATRTASSLAAALDEPNIRVPQDLDIRGMVEVLDVAITSMESPEILQSLTVHHTRLAHELVGKLSSFCAQILYGFGQMYTQLKQE